MSSIQNIALGMSNTGAPPAPVYVVTPPSSGTSTGDSVLATTLGLSVGAALIGCGAMGIAHAMSEHQRADYHPPVEHTEHVADTAGYDPKQAAQLERFCTAETFHDGADALRELNPRYHQMAVRHLAQNAPNFSALLTNKWLYHAMMAGKSHHPAASAIFEAEALHRFDLQPHTPFWNVRAAIADVRRAGTEIEKARAVMNIFGRSGLEEHLLGDPDLPKGQGHLKEIYQKLLRPHLGEDGHNAVGRHYAARQQPYPFRP